MEDEAENAKLRQLFPDPEWLIPVETISREEFEKRWPKAELPSAGELFDDGWDAGAAWQKSVILALADDLLARGPGFPCSTEFADGYSLAAQELVAGITGEGQKE